MGGNSCQPKTCFSLIPQQAPMQQAHPPREESLKSNLEKLMIKLFSQHEMLLPSKLEAQIEFGYLQELNEREQEDPEREPTLLEFFS